jgi:hypothetical protein
LQALDHRGGIRRVIVQEMHSAHRSSTDQSTTLLATFCQSSMTAICIDIRANLKKLG